MNWAFGLFFTTKGRHVSLNLGSGLMSIRVKCKCGQGLTVPDDKAGKSGKCPKCGELIRIPAPQANVAGSKAVAKPAPKTSLASTAASNPLGGIDDLLEEAGLSHRVGNFCPSCDTSFPNGAVFCVKCGLNFATGQKMPEYTTSAQRREFENMHLNEAAEMMLRDKAQDSRMRNAGMPWWVLLCMLLSGLITVGTGCLIVEGRQGTPRPFATILGKIQVYPVGWTALGLLCINCVLISVFAHFATTALAFRKSRSQGLLCMLIPGYSSIFGIMQFKLIRGTVISYWLAILIGAPSIIYMAIKAPNFNTPPKPVSLRIDPQRNDPDTGVVVEHMPIQMVRSPSSSLTS